MQPDPLSAFLHSQAWLNHSKGFYDQMQNVWSRQSLPKNIGQYLMSSRIFADENFQLPAANKGDWFYRVQADSTASHIALLNKLNGRAHKDVGSIQPKQTLVLDIQQSEEQIVAQMKPKHRYNAKVAEKHGVTIRIESDNLSNHLETFLQLLDEAANRHTFRTHTKQHYASIIEHLQPEGMVHLLFAEHEGKAVAGMMLITYKGVATYLHGGSDYNARSLMAPYLLHVKAMQFARQKNCVSYDFWGIHAIEKDGEYAAIENHPSSGTTRFKLGFGGTVVHYPQTIDIILNPFCYSLYTTATKFRSRKRAFA